MTVEQDRAPWSIVPRFRTGDEVLSLERLGSGHIHDTWQSRVLDRGVERSFVHQRINTHVFASPEQMMENLGRVTGHLATKIRAAGGDPARETLTVVPTLEGQALLREGKEVWRTFRHIDGTRTWDAPRSPEHVAEVGRAFGQFLDRIADLPPPRLHETIPGFGDTLGRLHTFDAVLEAAPLPVRVARAAEEIAFVGENRGLSRILVQALADRDVPERIIHFDTKLNNVLFDAGTSVAICVIDLDTVMPGTLLYDFGDAARRAACRGEEDSGGARLDLELFDALVDGFVAGSAGRITGGEYERLVDAFSALAFTIGLRFLTDYLEEDRYFRVTQPGQNLDRARGQFALVREVHRNRDEMRGIVENHRPDHV